MASIKIQGDTSGEITISAPAVAGTNTLTLPATSGTLLDTNSSLAAANLTGSLPAIDGSALTGISAGPVQAYITDSTDIVVTAQAPAGYHTIGSSFSVDIPTSGYISIKNLVMKLINDTDTADLAAPTIGLRVSSTNYWLATGNISGTDYYAPIVFAANTGSGTVSIINSGPHSSWNNSTFRSLGTNFNTDIINLGIPTGTQTVELIVAQSVGISTAYYDDCIIKGTDLTTRIGLEFTALS